MKNEDKGELIKTFGSLELNRGILNYFDEYEAGPASFTTSYCFDHPLLSELEAKYGIRAVAGEGAELEKIKRLFHWIHDTLRPGGYDGVAGNACALLDAFHTGRKGFLDRPGLNCFQYAAVFHECLLSIGVKAKLLNMEGFNPNQGGNHYAVHVFSNDLGKWIFMDPQYRAWFRAEDGTVLDAVEVRERLAKRRPLEFVDHDYYGYWDEEVYLIFLAKCLMTLKSPLHSGPESPGHFREPWVWLAPKGYDPLKREVKLKAWYILQEDWMKAEGYPEDIDDGWCWPHRRPNGSLKPMEAYEAFLRGNPNVIVSRNPADLF